MRDLYCEDSSAEVGKDTVAQDEVRGRRGDASAVVASASGNERAHLKRLLEDGGLPTRTVTTAASLLDEVLTARPDVLLVDVFLALAYADSLADTIAQHPQLTDLPVILLLPEGGAGELPDTLAPSLSDVVFRPLEATEVLQRTRSAIARRRHRQAQRASSERLREDMRRISARIRATNDPAVIVDQFLPAVGQALDAHHVALQVFDDDRVAAHSCSWTRDTDDGAAIAAPLRTHQEASLALALELWEDTATASFSSGPAAAPQRDDIPPPEWILHHARADPASLRGDDRTMHGVVAALGEGDTPFGLLWIMSEETPLTWTGVEAALTQHVLGNLAHGLIQAQLISRQQQAVRKLRALNQAKSDFVGTVNHELRTPLASIAGYLEMIIDGVGGELPPEAHTMLQAVERNTAKLSQLIDNISALSARETDASEHGPVDIVHLVSELTSRAVLQAAAGGITLDCALPDRLVTVSGDRGQLSAALAVVLSNAIKFTQQEGTVSVRLTQEPDHEHVVIVVQDTGIGIPADDLPRLFDAFHRASNATPALPGAGVGLSIAKKTLEDHHGTITIESSLGVGTSVAITLPLLNHAAVG
ncbi:two-component system phosphate regulon sensor histidine kinase PhoR [Arthrobacter sp. PL16]|nr:two-component system phosphate regulon sensor histidine kinase PhoR [Arthrobacter sp. PL16]